MYEIISLPNGAEVEGTVKNVTHIAMPKVSDQKVQGEFEYYGKTYTVYYSESWRTWFADKEDFKLSLTWIDWANNFIGKPIEKNHGLVTKWELGTKGKGIYLHSDTEMFTRYIRFPTQFEGEPIIMTRSETLERDCLATRIYEFTQGLYTCKQVVEDATNFELIWMYERLSGKKIEGEVENRDLKFYVIQQIMPPDKCPTLWEVK